MLKKKSRVVITSQIHQDGIKLLEPEAEIIFPEKPLNLLEPEDLLEICEGCDAIIVVTNVERVTKEVIEGLPRLRIISRHGVGYDNVDVRTASKRGVYVTTAPVLDETVADQAFALLLCLARRTCMGHVQVMSKQWKVKDPFKFMGVDVWGKTAGIVGLGRIGRRICERARGFKMEILYNDIARKRDLEQQLGVEFRSLNGLLRESDIIFIASPLTDETCGMISDEELALMKKTALLINVARGRIVNHDALVKVLRDRKIGGAGLDVFDVEPISPDDPLLGLDNVVLTPHMAANTIECRSRMAVTVAQDVLRVIHGKKPKYPVNPEIKHNMKL